MDINFYITRINGYGESPVADALLTPLRWLVNGKEYTVTRVYPSDKSSDKRLAAQEHEMPKGFSFTRTIKIMIGVVGTLTIVPIIFGIFIKSFFKNKKVCEGYKATKSLNSEGSTSSKNESVSESQGTVENLNNQRPKRIHICPDKISQAPQKIEPTEEELEGIESIKLDDLATLWDEKCSGVDGSSLTKVDLEDWLDKVKDSSKYDHIPEEIVKSAAEGLQKTLKLIVFNLREAKPEIVERVITALRDGGAKCSPTWIEVAESEYGKLKGGEKGGIEQGLLRYVQRAKENLLHEATRTAHLKWHVVNYIRFCIGDEIGLDKSRSRFDKVVKQVAQDPQYSKGNCRKLFKKVYTAENLINSVMALISMDNEPIVDEEKRFTANGLNTDLLAYLDDRADICAQREGVDMTSAASKYDSATYAMNNFYDKKTLKGKDVYYINRKGVEQILLKMGLIAD